MNYILNMRTRFAVILAMLVQNAVQAANPIVDGQGLCDPHAVVFDDRVYLFATHDFDKANKGFVMKDWWCWSSSDLLNWKHESTLKPEQTFIGKPFNNCWATFGVRKNGKYYWYFSAGERQIGVVTADSPAGPWRDPLGKPLIPAGMSPTESRDPDVLMDDDGKAYLVYGTFNYFIVRLNDDMISLAEPAHPLKILNAEGPYGKGKTDDKPSLHKRNGIYYLSWSSYYATSDTVYGPYTCKGSVIDQQKVAPEFRDQRLTHDRHGNFFEFNTQTYYISNDKSQPGRGEHYRDSIITTVHYKDNGDIAPVRIDRIGVGQYDASQPRIEAEDYFKSVKAEKRECPAGGFEMRGLAKGSALYYPNVSNLVAGVTMTIVAASGNPKGGLIKIRENSPSGKVLGTCHITPTGGWAVFKEFSCKLSNEARQTSLCLEFSGRGPELCRVDSFRFQD